MEPSKGGKPHKRSDTEDRAFSYRSYRRTFGDGCYVNDLDHVEWRVRDDVPTPVAVFELTRVDFEFSNDKHRQSYQDSILKRFNSDGQMDFVCEMAFRLGVPAYIILFQKNLKHFWLYNLSDDDYPNTGIPNQWHHKSETGYRLWVKNL